MTRRATASDPTSAIPASAIPVTASPVTAEPIAADASAADPATGPLNQVVLRGVLAAEATVRELPSGDEIAVFRLTVGRPPGGRVKVDSIDCASAAPRVRRSLLRCAAGDTVELSGSLHRRFWRGAHGLGSRYEVDVTTLKVLRRADRRSAG